MAMEPGRFEKRVGAAAVAVMLTSADPKGLWRANESLVIKSLEGDLYSAARVIYRQPIRENVCAIGLELIEPRGSWQGDKAA